MQPVDHADPVCPRVSEQRLASSRQRRKTASSRTPALENAAGSTAAPGEVNPPLADLSAGERDWREPHQDWLLWQLADSAFPSGGFAHSGGLEAAFQHGELPGPDTLSAFAEASLRQLGHASLPFMTAAYDTPARLSELDQLCDSFTTNHVANRASRLQGQALLASVERIFAAPEFQRIRPSRAEAALHGHLAPLFGVITRTLGFGRLPAARVFCFIHLRGLLSAAVRLGIVGPLQAQTLLHGLAPRAEKILRQCLNLTLEEAAQTAPLLDLWQANQDRLYSRLFQS
jgi:urease accessory protein